MYDLVIAGAGPAGLTGAVYAARKKLSTVIVAREIGGQVNWTSGVENYMGYQFIEGPELMHKFEVQAKQHQLTIKTDIEVTGVQPIDGGFEVITSNGEKFQGKTVLIATGKKPRSLNVPGERKFIGRGVSYCAICDGPIFAGMDVAVVGGGNSAVEVADDMTKIANKVYLISSTQLTSDAVLIDKIKSAQNIQLFLEYEVMEIKGDKLVSGIKIRDLHSKKETELNVGGVFVEIGLVPNSDSVKSIVALNNLGEVIINNANETSVKGLLAAGDVTNVPEKQIVIAAGEGAKAVLTAHRYLQHS
jgi:NADH-dependent peroxiredoxin subunit F